MFPTGAKIVTTLLLTLNIAFSSFSGPRVTSVLDGDTVVLGNKRKVRILGIDAPKVNLCGGKSAKQTLGKLVLNKQVYAQILRKDMYKRELAALWQGQTLVAEKLLESGAVRADYTDIQNNERLKKALNQAKRERRGLWSGQCQSASPPQPACTIKGNIEENTGNRFYHLPFCRHYDKVIIDLDRGERWFCTEAEAIQAGFKKVKRCE